MSEAVKHDNGKTRWDLVPWEAVEGAAKVLTLGAEKYGDRNWEQGLLYGRVYAALMRHITAWWLGEESDQDDGLHHLDHAACCVMFLQAFVHRGVEGLDDRTGTHATTRNLLSNIQAAVDQRYEAERRAEKAEIAREQADAEYKKSQLDLYGEMKARKETEAGAARLREALWHALQCWEYDGVSDEHGSTFRQCEKILGDQPEPQGEPDTAEQGAVNISPWLQHAATTNGPGDAPQMHGRQPDNAEVDEVVTRLYKRFRDWSRREFGPDDVTWCEVRADVIDIIQEMLAQPQQNQSNS